MVLARTSPRTDGYRRRTVLTGLGAGALALLGHPAEAAGLEGEYPMQVYVPVVSEFRDDYEGQFLTITEPAGSDVGAPEQLHGSCGDVPWPEDRTNVNVGQLTDRRSDRPVAVRVPVYMDEQDSNLVEDALFVISDAEPCQEGFVRLDVEWVSTRSLVGKPAGPTVQGDDADGSAGDGFGLLAGTVGLAGGLLAWLHRRRD